MDEQEVEDQTEEVTEADRQKAEPGLWTALGALLGLGLFVFVLGGMIGVRLGWISEAILPWIFRVFIGALGVAVTGRIVLVLLAVWKRRV